MSNIEKSIIKIRIFQIMQNFVIIGLLLLIIWHLIVIEHNQTKIKTDTGRNYRNILECNK